MCRQDDDDPWLVDVGYNDPLDPHDYDMARWEQLAQDREDAGVGPVFRPIKEERGVKITGADRHEEPKDDKLHRLAAAMLAAFEAHPEAEGVHAIAFITEDKDGRSNAVTALCGYDEDGDAAVDLMAHLGAIFEANGVKIQFIPMDQPVGEG